LIWAKVKRDAKPTEWWFGLIEDLVIWAMYSVLFMWVFMFLHQLKVIPVAYGWWACVLFVAGIEFIVRVARSASDGWDRDTYRSHYQRKH
jgi:hypothetical protein